jgi:hypothetical protein
LLSPLPSSLPPFLLPFLLPITLVAIAITHVVAIAIAITIVAVACPPPLSQLLLPPSPLPSLWNPTLLASANALFVALALFITHHLYCRHHCLAALTLLFVTALIIQRMLSHSLLPAVMVVWLLTLSSQPPPTFETSIANWLLFFNSPMNKGGFGPSFAPPIQQTANSSNVAGALPFNAFTFFATNPAALTTALGVGTNRIAFSTAAGAATTAADAETSAASVARTAGHFRQGVAHMVQYLPPLLLTMWMLLHYLARVEGHNKAS